MTRLLLWLGIFGSRRESLERIRRVFELLRPLRIREPLIRIGENDGGYLVPDNLDGVAIAFSPGVGQEISFELGLLDRGIRCQLIDGSVESSPLNHPGITFRKMWLSARSNPPTSISLSDWVRATNSDADLLLQMDIEGDEYVSLLATPETVLARFRYIILEMHDLWQIASSPGNKLVKEVLSLLRSNHIPVHVHPNNCCGALNLNGMRIPQVLEVTFARKDSVTLDGGFSNLPNPLDVENTAGRALNVIWGESPKGS